MTETPDTVPQTTTYVVYFGEKTRSEKSRADLVEFVRSFNSVTGLRFCNDSSSRKPIDGRKMQQRFIITNQEDAAECLEQYISQFNCLDVRVEVCPRERVFTNYGGEGEC